MYDFGVICGGLLFWEFSVYATSWKYTYCITIAVAIFSILNYAGIIIIRYDALAHCAITTLMKNENIAHHVDLN